MNARRRIAGATAAVAGIGMTLAGAPGYGQAPARPPVRAVGAVAPASAIPIGLRAHAAVSTEDAPTWTTYPADFDFTNSTPYTLHIWPETQSGDECWDNPGNPNITLKPGETAGGRAWTQERHLHCYIAFRVAVVGPSGEYLLKPSQPFYPGPASDTKSTFTFWFPDGPRDSAWIWAPWGYWALPQKSMGVDMSKNAALFFRVNTQKDDLGSWDKCRDKNNSAIYCHVTIATGPPGSIRPWEFFEKGVKPTAEKSSLAGDPASWPTIANIQADGCRSRGIIESLCSKVDGPGTDFTGLTVQEKEFKLDTKNVQIVGDKIDTGTWVNSTPKDSEYKFTRSLTTGEDSSSTSTHSHSVGGSVSFGVKSKWSVGVKSMGVDFNVTVNTDHKWEYTDTKTTSKSETKSSEYTIPVPKYSKVDWRILQNTINTTQSQYTADVVIGPDTDKVEPIISPVYSNSLISPVDQQPCLATSIGNYVVDYSMLSLKEWVQNTGGIGPEARIKRFLDNTANFGSAGQCPGMPGRYPSRAWFKGTGYVTDTQKGMSAACTYYAPIKKSGPSAQPPRGPVVNAGSAPKGDDNTIYNTAPKCDGPKLGKAVSFDASMVPFVDQDTIIGTKYGDLLMAKNRSGVTLLGGESRDVIEGGKGVNNVLDGQDGDDVITGGPADEVLRGGKGSDNLKGGAGDDELIDQAGIGNWLSGGPGDDELRAVKGRTTLSGDKGKDVLTAVGGHVGMVGGTGKDTYLVKARAKDAGVTEVHGQGRDIIKSWRSFTAPEGVEVLKLQGSKNLKAAASESEQKIVGNDGDNVTQGAGFGRLIGGAGKDTIKLSDTGWDKATGGAGADRYILPGRPSPEGTLATGKNPMAHEITDFMPGSDKLVLSVKVHGPEVVALKKAFRVFDPTSMNAPVGSGPALVVNTKTGVVKYDRDERGRSPERVLVRLPKGVSLTAKEIVIR